MPRNCSLPRTRSLSGVFAKVEETLAAEGLSLKEASLEEMESAWQKAKDSED